MDETNHCSWMLGWKPVACSLGICIVAICSSCAPVSSNGIGGEISQKTSTPSVRAQGIQEFHRLKKSKKVSSNPSYKAQVSRVGSRLSKVIPGNRSWEFVVFEDKTPNAFALPGGKVGVNTGIFQITQNEAGLAAVMGHEMAHVIGAHAQARLHRQKTMALGGAILDSILQTQGASAGARQMAKVGNQVVFGLPHSRAHELEADRVGTLLMAQAGYHPGEALNFWKRFNLYNKKKKGQSAEFLRTHPLDSTRINALQRYLPTAMRAYQGS